MSQSGNDISSDAQDQPQPPPFHAFLRYLKPYLTVTSFIEVLLLLLFFYLLFLLNLIAFFATAQYAIMGRDIGSIFRVMSTLSGSLVTGICVVATLASTLVGISVYFNENNQNGVRYMLEQMSKKIFPHSRLLMQICLAAAGFLILTGYMAAIISFIVIGLLAISTTLLNQNYLLRKDYLCCRSFKFALILRIIQVLGMALNAVAPSTTQAYLVCLFGHSILAGTLYATYFTLGFRMYRHPCSRICLQLFVSSYLTMALLFLLDYLSPFSTTAFYIYLALLLVAVTSFSVGTLNTLKERSLKTASKNVFKKVYFTMKVLEQAETEVESDCLIRGLIKSHVLRDCVNPQCFTHIASLHDAKKKKDVEVGQIRRDKLSLTKFYVKCLFEQALEEDGWLDTDLVLEYVQYTYSKLRDAVFAFQVIARLQIRWLSPFQQLRVIRLKELVRWESEVMRKEMPNQLDIENVIQLQRNFLNICEMIQAYLAKSAQFWGYVQNIKVDISVLRSIADQLFLFKERLNETWKKVSKYLEHNMRWKFYFICYTLYVRNEKVRYQFVEEFGSSVDYQRLFTLQQFELGQSKKELQLSSKMVFEHNTALVQVKWENQDLIIKRVSTFFQGVLGYEEAEIIESSLGTLLSPTIRTEHNSIFLEWASLRANNPERYKIRKIYPMHKKGHYVSSYFQLKQFVSDNEQLNYVGIIKSIATRDVSLLLNSRFEMEAISALAAKTLHLNLEHTAIGSINILPFLPALIRFTPYNKAFIKSPHRLLLQQAAQSGGKNTFQRTSTMLRYQQETDLSSVDTVHLECEMRFPSNIDKAIAIYSQAKAPDNDVFRAVEAVFLELGECTVYNCQLGITRRVVRKEIYYEMSFKVLEIINDSFGEEQIRSNHQIEEQAVRKDNFNMNFQENLSFNRQISILPSNNIFLKEDSNQANEGFFKITCIVIVIRILFLLLISIIIFQFFNETQSAAELSAYGQQYQIVNRLRKETFQLMIYFRQVKYGIGLDSNQSQKITNLAGSIVSCIKSTPFKKILFDQSISGSQLYSVYDKIDLTQMVLGVVVALGTDHLSINTTTDFSLIASLLLPYFNQFMQLLEGNLAQIFSSKVAAMQTLEYVMIGIYGVLILVNLVAFILSVHRAMSSFRTLIELYVQLDEFLIKKIQDYIGGVTAIFHQLNSKNIQFRKNIWGGHGATRIAQNSFSNYQTVEERKEERNNANLNKKAKQIEAGQLMRGKKIKPILCFLSVLIAYAATMVSFNFIKSSQIRDLGAFFASGYRLKYFTLPNLIMEGCYESSYSPSTFQPNLYSPSVTSLDYITSNDVVASDTSNQYTIAQSLILISNFCPAKPELLPLWLNVTYCESLISNQLQLGAYGILNHIIDSLATCATSTSTPPIPLLQMSDAIKIMNPYFLYLMETWLSVLDSGVKSFESQSRMWFAIIITLQILIHIICVENYIVAYLHEEYTFYRNLYEHMMPEFVVETEKTIKARLQVEGFLRK